MNISDRLFVEIHLLETGQVPHPHPVNEGHFDPALIYKVLGMYNASETSECYFVLVNPQRQIWFIPQRHLLAFGLLDSDEFFLTRPAAEKLRHRPATNWQDSRNGKSSGGLDGAEPSDSQQDGTPAGTTTGDFVGRTTAVPTNGFSERQPTVPPDLRSAY